MRKEIALPFVGFYGSIISDALDNIVENDDEYVGHTSQTWSAIYEQVAKNYADRYNELFLEETGINLGIEFVKLWSPRFYNFETDRIYVTADEDSLEKIISEIGIDKVRKSLREQYKPQSGFSPFSSTLEAIEKDWKNFPELFWADVILELLFNSELIYNDDTFNTQLNESYFTTQ